MLAFCCFSAVFSAAALLSLAACGAGPKAWRQRAGGRVGEPKTEKPLSAAPRLRSQDAALLKQKLQEVQAAAGAAVGELVRSPTTSEAVTEGVRVTAQRSVVVVAGPGLARTHAACHAGCLIRAACIVQSASSAAAVPQPLSLALVLCTAASLCPAHLTRRGKNICLHTT